METGEGKANPGVHVTPKKRSQTSTAWGDQRRGWYWGKKKKRGMVKIEGGKDSAKKRKGGQKSKAWQGGTGGGFGKLKQLMDAVELVGGMRKRRAESGQKAGRAHCVETKTTHRNQPPQMAHGKSGGGGPLFRDWFKTFLTR